MSQWLITVEEPAWREALAAASVNPMRETGGILLGWRSPDGIHVTSMLQVLDRRAGHTFYRRRKAPAEVLLQSALAKLAPTSPVGWVGEWHTHPAPVGPSWQDRRQMRRIAKKASGPLALLVWAHDAVAKHWTPVGGCVTASRYEEARVELLEEP
jgi:integrative and conjugative element protein (TIGR02256 family)